MYKNIEKNYKKKNPENKLYTYYWICSVIATIIVLILSHFGVNDFILLLLLMVSLIIAVIIYEFRNYKNYNIEIHKLTDYFTNYKFYIKKEKEVAIDNLVEILNNENINTKREILLFIDYYNKKLPINIKKSIWESIASLAVTIVSIVVIFVDEENKTIDYDKIAIVMESFFGVILVVIFMYLVLKLFISVKKSKETFYSELVDKLTIIYINYDKYKSKLKKKQKFSENNLHISKSSLKHN